MSFVRGGLRVDRVGEALCVAYGGVRTLVDCPEGTAVVAGSVDRLWLTSGDLSRIAGVLAVLIDPPAEICFSLRETRAASIVEAWQRAWEGAVVLDAVQPGSSLEQDGVEVQTAALRGGLGLRWQHPEAVVVCLPPGAIDAAARRLCRGADLVVADGILDLSALQNVGEVWSSTMAMA